MVRKATLEKSRNATARENAELAVTENAKWVDATILSIATVSGTIVLLKFLGVKEFKWNDIKLEVSFAWLVIFLFTVAHFYTAVLLIRSLRKYWEISDKPSRHVLFERIVASGGLLIRGIIPRTECRDYHEVFVVYKMSFRDPTAWISVIGYLLMIAAVIPFEASGLSGRRSLVLLSLVAIILAQVNWAIGSHWVIALCDLAQDRDRSIYFRRAEKGGIRLMSVTSGGYAFLTIPWLFIPLWALFNPMLMLLTLYGFG